MLNQPAYVSLSIDMIVGITKCESMVTSDSGYSVIVTFVIWQGVIVMSLLWAWLRGKQCVELKQSWRQKHLIWPFSGASLESDSFIISESSCLLIKRNCLPAASFQNPFHFFLLWSTEDVLQNIHAALLHIMKANGDHSAQAWFSVNNDLHFSLFPSQSYYMASEDLGI